MYHNGYLKRRMDKRSPYALAIGLATVFLICFALLPALALATDAGFLAKVEGRVDILRSGQRQAVQAMESDPVSIGDVIRTKSGGRVEIHFNDDTVLRLAPGSRLKIDKYVFNSDNTRKNAAVTLFRGKLRAVVTKASSVVPVSSSTTTFNINTPTAVAGVLGTDLFVFYEGGTAGVLFKDGHGIVFNPNLSDQVVRVPAGFVTFITGGTEPPLEPRQATDLELSQHVRDTTLGAGGDGSSGGPSTGGDNLLGYVPPPPDDDGGGWFGAWLANGGTGDGTGGGIPVTVYDPELLGDYTPPVITLAGVPGAYTNQSFANMLITTDEPATFVYIFNGIGANTTTLSTADTFNVAGLPEGILFTFTVVARDAKGNISDPIVVSWITDYTPPSIVMTTGIPSLTNVQTTDFSLTSSEPVNYTYLLDGVSVGTPTPLVPVEGPHTFIVTATDRAGNTSNTESYSWNSDYTAPNILSALIPNPVSSQPTADVSLTVDDPSAALSYSLDSGAWTPMGPTLNLAGLAEGAHTIDVQAVDAAGNATVWSSLANWFYGNRAYTLDGLVSGTGAVTTGTASGDLAVIAAGTQGGWNMGFTPAGAGNASWTATAGGKGFDATAAFNGYWAYNGVYDGASLTGSSDLRYLSYTAYGTGTHTGSYDASTRSWNTGDFGYGTYTEAPLDFSGNVWGGLLWYDPSYLRLRYANVDAFDNTPNVNGIIGLVGNLWTTGSAQAYLMGTYNTYSGSDPYLIYGSGWYMNYDPTVIGYSTSLGGAFNGYNVGVWNNGVTKSNAVAIYIDPSGNAGYLKGGLDGSYDSGTGIWEMNGPVSTQFMETTAIAPADLALSLATGRYGPYGAAMSGSFASTGGVISTTYMEGSLKGLIGHNWGVWNGGMAGNYDTANTSSSFTADVGASDFSYNGYWGYMLGSMSSSNWGVVGNSFTGSLSTQFMTPTLLGNMTTDGLYGTFDPATGYWQSSMVGTWSATPLAFVSDISATPRMPVMSYNGFYNYADYGHYQYSYYSDNFYRNIRGGGVLSGGQDYYRPSLGQYYHTYYYSDGTTSIYDYYTGTSSYGTWDTTQSLSLYFVSPPDSTNAALNYTNANPERWANGSFNGLLGGTDSLWASASTPVTFMGIYNPSIREPHIYGTVFGSYDYINYTDTTYDNGAYYGYITGTEVNDAMDSLLYALYVDPSGNVGYLKGGLSGAARPDLGMFEETGTLNRVEMASATGITAADFYNSIYFSYGGAGQLSGPSLSGYDYGLYTMTLIDPQTALAQDWGLYYHEFIGQSTNPANIWTAMAGGNDAIGVINPYVSNNGAAYYADGGYYQYTYNSNNSYGSQGYFRPSIGTGTSTIYNSDGSTWIYNYAWGDPYGWGYNYWYYTGAVTGAWDPVTTSLSSLATPLDSANVTSSDAPYVYVGGSNNWAYWLMDVTGTAWSGDKLAATASGRFLSRYSMGTLSGDLSGVYDPVSGAWSANGAGIYESTPLAFSGDSYAYYYYYDSYWDQVSNPYWDSINSIFGTTQSPFAAPGTSVPLYLMGQNYPSSGLVSWWGSISGNDYVDVNSKWSGWMAGTTSNDNVNGLMKALYIDANGNAGILTGDFSGAVYPDVNNIFEAQGTLLADEKATGYVNLATYVPADFWTYINSSSPTGALSGQFAANNGSISSTNIGNSQTMWLTNASWGIYKLELGGYGDYWGATSIAMDLGGQNWKGSVTGDTDYWLAHITGNWRDDTSATGPTIDGTVTGRYLTPYALGDITGNMLGSWPPDSYSYGTWEGVALGEFTEQPLAFSGTITYASGWWLGPFWGLYGDSLGSFAAINNVSGLVGGTSSPWAWDGVNWVPQTAAVTYMGQSYAAASDHLNPLIWNDDLYSYNANDSTYTTYDGGEFYGFIGGVWKDGAIDGRVVSLYIDPDGNAGYIKGDVSGFFYTGLNNVFEADGQWTATQMATAADMGYISGIYDYCGDGCGVGNTDSGMTANISGSFGSGNGWMYGFQYSNGSWTRWINDQDWGIYDLIISGYDYGTWSNPLNDTTWSATMGGSAQFGTYKNTSGWQYSDNGYYVGDITGVWDVGKVSGAFSATFLSRSKIGLMSGDLLGYYGYDYYGYASWAATSLGVWEGVPLAHSGDVAADSNGAGFYAFDVTDGDCWYCLSMVGKSTGLMGGATAPWSGTPNITYMGTYSHTTIGFWYEVGLPYLWTPEIYSSNDNVVGPINTTIDGGMYKGFIGGVWNGDGTIDAKVYSLYVDPAGNAGILKGDVTGAYYPAFNMFAANGTWTPTQMTTGLNAATDTVNVVTYDYGANITASSSGSVNGAYVANYIGQTVSVIDTATNTVAATIPVVGNGSNEVAVNPQTNRAYVANYNGTVSVIDTTNNTVVATIAVGGILRDIAVNMVTNMAYVTDNSGNNVYVIDTLTNTVVGLPIPVGPNPYTGIAVNPQTNKVYVANNGNDTVSVIDATNTVVATIAVGLMPRGVAVNPLTDRAYVTNFGGVSVSVIDTVTDSVLTTIDLTTFYWAFGNVNGVTVNPQTNRAYVTGYFSNLVAVIDTLTNTVIAIIPVGLNPSEIDVDPQTNRVYVTNQGSNTVSVIDTLTNTVIATVGVGNTPWGVDAYTYTATYPYGTFNGGSGSITVAGNGTYSAAFTATDWRYSIAGQDWGIWKSIIGGEYTGTPANTWSLNTLVDLSGQGTVYGTMTEGTQWSNGVIKGQTFGYGADITAPPQTWISAGETFGTFDATQLTWQAAQTSAWIETSKYLAMTKTAAGQATLGQLNIPFAEVGRTDLTGTDGNLAVSMNNVVFLAPTSGAAPRLWATDGVGNGAGGVTGTYSVDPAVNTTVGLSGSGINADFTVKNWTAGAWLATINGGGTPSGAGAMDGTAITMSGAGAGTYNAGTLDGTAVGVVQ